MEVEGKPSGNRDERGGVMLLTGFEGKNIEVNLKIRDFETNLGFLVQIWERGKGTEI